jgi:hypothetical protein
VVLVAVVLAVVVFFAKRLSRRGQQRGRQEISVPSDDGPTEQFPAVLQAAPTERIPAVRGAVSATERIPPVHSGPVRPSMRRGPHQ